MHQFTIPQAKRQFDLIPTIVVFHIDPAKQFFVAVRLGSADGRKQGI
ncbi:MAG: hypothetical protein ACXW1W_14945 [Methylococcaceae bacterium]